MPSIQVRGARTHHLQNLDLDLPRDAWTVVCGVSGSGKSSLVLDTLGAESCRRFLGTLERAGAAEGLVRPDVDRVDGLPPAVLAGFDGRAPGPRETLASVADVLDGLRTLWARTAVPHCPACGRAVAAVAPEKVIETLLARPAGTRVVLLAPRGTGPDALAAARRDGYVRVRVGGVLARLDETPAPEAAPDARVEVVVDRLVVRPDARVRFADSVDQGFRTGGGVLTALVEPPAGAPGATAGAAAAAEEIAFADRPFCAACGLAYPPLAPGLFSANGPAGACPACQGLGSVPRLDPERVLPRDERLSRARARVLAAIAKADRADAARAFGRAMAAATLEGRDRVAALPEAARRRLLGDAKKPGLLAWLEARDRWAPFATERPCDACAGRRLAPFPAAARVEGTTLPDLLAGSVADAAPRLAGLALRGAEGALARPVRDDLVARLRFLADVGLGYVDLGRPAAALSGGELRRARLAAACAARMSGLLFLLDEPTMGLHPADRGALRTRLRALTAEGNTVICVEHDPAVLREADHVVELGPGAGVDGGRILAQGPAADVLAAGPAPIARALLGPPVAPRAAPRHPGAIRVVGAKARTLAGVAASFAAPGLTCVTGVSGAGKSTLVLEVLAPAARAVLARAPFPSHLLDALEGFDGFDRVSVSEGAPSRHPRASAGSVLGVLAPLRDLFAATVEARARGLTAARFSTAVPGGRCEACRGLGRRAVRLRHLPELAAPCDVCEGRRFRRDVLDVRVKGLSFADVLDLPLGRAADVFRDLEGVGRPLRAATDVGLGYVPLGEATERVSGGEALRLRLAAALGRAGRARTLYLLDEPCAGLHPADVAHLARVLLRLTEGGDAVVAVEHHPDLIRLADHVVDLGPGAGPAGGRLVVEGPPAVVARHRTSATARALR
ncbi:MAG: AAA family ATPase [Planctomycetota bacterium]